MTVINRPKSAARTYIWAIVLGFVGFIFGYFGQPLLLADPSAVASVIGSISLGLIGLFVGVLLGELSTRLHLSTRQNLLFLAIAVLAGTVGTLCLMVSKYRPDVWLVDAEIVGCERVDRLLASQTKMWSEVVVRPDNIRSARPNWEQEIPDMLRAQPGAVLTMRIYQEAWVREQRWSWGGISKRVDDWKSANEIKQVFAAVTGPMPRSPCERFTIGERRFSALVWEKSNLTPPEKLPKFMRLPVLQEVPPEYVRFLPKSK